MAKSGKPAIIRAPIVVLGTFLFMNMYATKGPRIAIAIGSLNPAGI